MHSRASLPLHPLREISIVCVAAYFMLGFPHLLPLTCKVWRWAKLSNVPCLGISGAWSKRSSSRAAYRSKTSVKDFKEAIPVGTSRTFCPQIIGHCVCVSALSPAVFMGEFRQPVEVKLLIKSVSKIYIMHCCKFALKTPLILPVPTSIEVCRHFKYLNTTIEENQSETSIKRYTWVTFCGGLINWSQVIKKKTFGLTVKSIDRHTWTNCHIRPTLSYFSSGVCT